MNVWDVAGAVIVSVGGGAVLVWGLSSWLGKVWAERILEKDRANYQTAISKLQHEMEQANRRLQVHLDGALHVHRVQFEAEFAAMKTIWEKTMTARGTMAAVRPTFGIAPIDETPEQSRARLLGRCRAFSAALEELKDAVFNNSPFISEALHRELLELLRAAQAEETSLRVHRPEEADWYETGEKNLGKLMQSAERASQFIRERMARLSVVPDADR